jgi:MFS family permease
MIIFRKILAVLGGVFFGVIAITLMEKLGQNLYPRPMGMKDNDMEALKQYVATAPFMALFFVILGYAAGAFVAGFIATKIAGDNKKTYAVICGVIFLLQGIYMMAVLPTPIWFWVLGITVWGLVLVGHKLALNKRIAV